jgi:hypothetical protein
LLIGIVDWDCRFGILPIVDLRQSAIGNRQIDNPNRKSPFSIPNQQSLKSAIANRQSTI